MLLYVQRWCTSAVPNGRAKDQPAAKGGWGGASGKSPLWAIVYASRNGIPPNRAHRASQAPEFSRIEGGALRRT
jgi:hypothetical protein